MASSRVRRSVVAVLLLATSILATGCLGGDIGLKVNADGGGEFTLKVFPSPEVQKRLEDLGAVDAAKLVASGRDGATFEQKTVDGKVSYQATVKFDDYSQISTFLTSGVFLDGKSIKVFNTFSLTKSPEDNWELKADLAPDLGPLKPADPKAATTTTLDLLDMDLSLSVSLPGKVTDSNSDEVDGGTATWNLRATDTKLNLSMKTEPKPRFTGAQIALMVLGAVLLIGLIALVVVLRRRARAKRAEKWAARPAPGPPGGGFAGGGFPGASGPGGGLPGAPSLPVQSAPVQPSLYDLEPVAPPTPPSFNPNQPNPFAPHRPGAPLPGSGPQPTTPASTAPLAPTAPIDPSATGGAAAPAPTPVESEPVAPAQVANAPAEPEPEPVAPAPAPAADGISADWYPDPDDPSRYRWWDGQNWTDHVS